MTTPTPEIETTLKDLSVKLDKLSTDNEKFNIRLDKLLNDNEKFNGKFDNYQKATQWVVQLAFSLIASATITVIITSILRK